MSDSVVYAIKGDENWAETIFESLRRGEGRFGWSYIEGADMNKLNAKVQEKGWSALSKEEQDCFQYFLLELKSNDWVVYVNVPKWGQCTLGRVTKPYFWKYEDEDFNHRFAVDSSSIRTFDRNDALVHPALSARLKLQGRKWRIYLTKEFQELVKSLQKGASSSIRSERDNLRFLNDEIRPLLAGITEHVHHTHPNYDLEYLMADILRAVPGVKEVEVKGGAGDRGADLLLIFDAGLPIPGLQVQSTCVVQVKSFEGPHWDTKAVKDIRRAFDHYPDATTGLIVSTAATSTSALDHALDDLREETGKPVALLIGADLAAFILRFWTQVLA